MTTGDIYCRILEWEYASYASPNIFELGLPVYNNKFIFPLHKKDSVEIPISFTGNIISSTSLNNIIHSLVTINFDNYTRVHKYLKNYKKLIETFFICTNRFSYYSAEQFAEKYFIGRGILTDDNGNILCLVTRNYIKNKDSEGNEFYVYENLDAVNDLIFYISPILIANPRNAFEKAFIKNIYNNVLTWNSSRIIIDSHINKLFLLDKNHIESREDLRYKLSKIAESSDRIIDSIGDYVY